MAEGEIKNDELWRDRLTSEEYAICRQGATEPPFSGAYLSNKQAGSYHCRCCHSLLFSSKTKYDSGSGWPSFYEAVAKGAIHERLDQTMGMTRTEISCAKCDAHLGHLFTDGPAPTGMRYCVNSASLAFDSDASSNK